MNRKICVVTGSRAEYGLLRWVMEGVRARADLQLQVVVTGMHLAPEFGLTWREIENDGFKIDHKVEMLLDSDTAAGVAKSMGLGLIGFADALGTLRPDLLVLLGDRFEILPAAAAALVGCIPVAHLHGGETTEGALDEAIRHSITKMSHLHFVAADEYRRRVVQLGEDPQRVHVVGGLGIDAIKRLRLLERAELEDALGFALGARSLLVTFHPATLDDADAGTQLRELLAALDDLHDTQLIFTLPNADAGGRTLAAIVNDYVATRPHARAFASLGQLRYLSCMRHVDGIVGNSSSGLIEMPSFGKGTVNIGDRQRGRLRATSVIDCPAERTRIAAAIGRLFDGEFRLQCANIRNPYGDGDASQRVVSIIADAPLQGILKKKFHDLPVH